MAVSHTRQNTITYAAVGVTAASAVVFDDVQGHGSLVVMLEGTFNLGAATFEGTIDRTNWFAVGAAVAQGGSFSASTGAVVQTGTASAYVLPLAAGVVSVRLRVSTFTSGVMNVSAVAAGGSLSVPSTATVSLVGATDLTPIGNVLDALKVTGPTLIISIESDASHNPQYLGLAEKTTTTAQALWQIRKFTIDANSNVSAIRYANGSAAFNAVWDDRATLSYS